MDDDKNKKPHKPGANFFIGDLKAILKDNYNECIVLKKFQ